ncbi:hypothetical protein F2P79_009244 [Pimephales promelas]|nr:hypothetical protein F2P79_009244 [Pimephales promelas]
MGKTADLTAVQKAIIDTLKQEVGSLWERKSVAKNAAQREEVTSLRKIVEKDRFQILGDLRKQWTEWSRNIQSHRAQVCAGNGLQVLHSPGQATFEPETAAEAPDLGYREAALDCCSVFACHSEIKIREQVGTLVDPLGVLQPL